MVRVRGPRTLNRDPRRSVPTIIVVAAVVERDRSFLVTRRRHGAHLEGCWEFPGGKCEVGETHATCLRREMREELDVDITIGEELLSTTHRYPDRIIRLHFYRCDLDGTPRPRLGQAMQWVLRDRLGSLTFPPADEKLVAQLRTEV